MTRTTWIAGIVIAAVVIGGGRASSQTSTPRPTQRPAGPRPATMQVIVRDRSGTLLQGVRVVLSGGLSRDAITDATGVALMGSLPAGSYRLRFEREGFVTFEREITVRAGQPMTIDIALSAAPAPPPPRVEPASARGTPAPKTAAPAPPVASGQAVNISIPGFIDKNFIGREPLKESVIGCTTGATTRLLQLRDPLAEHTHSDLDEILYVVAGEGTIRVREEANPVAAGSLTVIPRAVPHAIERRGRNPLIVLSTLAGAPCRAGQP